MTRRGLLGASLAAPLVARVQARAAETTIRLAHEENAPGSARLISETVASFEHSHPGLEVSQLYLENAAYKAKLTTMLQSDDRPDILYSWGRGTLDAQVSAGVLRDVTATVQGWGEDFTPVALDAFRIGDHLWGAPFTVSGVGFYGNRALLARTGVDLPRIESFDDLLAAVARLKAAGIVPITVGGGEKWPLHFYWAMLALRLGGRPAFDDARAGRNGGFAAPVFVEAGRMLQRLGKSGAFQPGFAGAQAPDSYGQFGDGKAAMTLMGSWIMGVQKANAANGQGLSDEAVAYRRFPLVAGGRGKPTDTFGGVNGWAVTRSAPAPTLDLLHALTSSLYERTMCERNVYLPAVRGLSQVLTSTVLRQVAAEIDASTYHLLFLDQTLGPSLGSVVNDVSFALATGDTTPEAGAKQIEDARQAEDM